MNDDQALLERPAVKSVRAALLAGGARDRVQVLAATARTAEDASLALGVEVGAIVKSLIFAVGGGPVLVLVAGDRRCRQEALPSILGLTGKVSGAEAKWIKETTGFTIGGVAPVGHLRPLPTAIDASLGRFETLFAAAGHPHCVFPTNLEELARITGGTVADTLAA